MDLNLIVSSPDGLTANIQDILKRSFEMGYERVAINTIIDSSNLSGKNINIPEPKLVSFEGKFGRKFTIMSRLTAIVEEPIHAHHLLKSPITKKYDILAIQPVGEKMLHHVTSQFDVDIISLNLAEDLGFHVKKTHISLAFQKSMCFEINYSPSLRSQSCKRSVISNSQHLFDVCKGKNIIISSGALRPLEIRSPEDVINLSLLFGFKLNQGVDAVRKNGHSVIAHAGTRKNTGCGFVSITGCMRIPKQQGWIVKVCKAPRLKIDLNVQKRPLEAAATEEGDDNNKNKKIKLENKDASS